MQIGRIGLGCTRIDMVRQLLQGHAGVRLHSARGHALGGHAEPRERP